MSQGPYEVLGVHPQATHDEIKKAYHALVGKYHPDRNPGSPETVVFLREINAAWAILGDPIKRTSFDAEARTAKQSPPAPPRAQAPPRTERTPPPPVQRPPPPPSRAQSVAQGLWETVVGLLRTTGKEEDKLRLVQMAINASSDRVGLRTIVATEWRFPFERDLRLAAAQRYVALENDPNTLFRFATNGGYPDYVLNIAGLKFAQIATVIDAPSLSDFSRSSSIFTDYATERVAGTKESKIGNDADPRKESRIAAGLKLVGFADVRQLLEIMNNKTQYDMVPTYHYNAVRVAAGLKLVEGEGEQAGLMRIWSNAENLEPVREAAMTKLNGMTAIEVAKERPRGVPPPLPPAALRKKTPIA